MAKTREENLAKLVELRATADQKALEYNEALQKGEVKLYMKLDEEIKEAIGEYTGIVKLMCYQDCCATEDPMLAAVKTLTFMTIVAKDTLPEDSKIPVRTIEAKEKDIDLLDLDKYARKNGGEGIGHEKNWAHHMQAFNCALTAQKALDLGASADDLKTINDSYNMSTIAQAIEMGKNPCSKTQMLKTLQSVITDMLGDGYKATSHDVNYLMSVYSKKGKKALAVSCASHRHLAVYIGRVCHRIVTGKSYEVEYKKRKDA
jgi:hypothetical protein